jgi:hypothetical protein
MTPGSVEAAAPWTSTFGCYRYITHFVGSYNPNVSYAYQRINSQTGPPCASMKTTITANLFGSALSASSACVAGYIGLQQYSPGAYGNPWWTTTAINFVGSGSATECSQTQVWQ